MRRNRRLLHWQWGVYLLQVAAGVVGGNRRRRWHAASVEALVALALAGSIVYVPVMRSRNSALRDELAAKAGEASEARTLSITLRRNLELSALEGFALPDPVARRVRSAAGPRSTDGATGIFVMIYTPMVCQRALRAGLQTLTSHRSLRERGLATYVVVGENGPADRERALLFRAEGTLPFPLAFLPADTLVRALFPGADDTFDEEPIYLRLDLQLNVRSAFHADQRRPELLDFWLEHSGNATSLRLLR